MVPANDPKLLVAVVVDEPQGAIYGGSVAAPAFQKIVGWAVPYFGINPTRRRPAWSGCAGQDRRRLRSAASRASRSSHWPPTSAIHETASDSGAGVTR